MAQSRDCIGVLVSEAIRQYDAVRKRPGGMLDTLVDRAIRGIGKGSGAAVRGNVVAADSILTAILKYAKEADYRLFVHPGLKASIASDVALSKQHGPPTSSITVHSVGEIIRAGLDPYKITAWLTPLLADTDTEGIETSQVIRSSYSSHVFPVVILTHGLSSHKILYNLFLRLMLEGTYPCDSLICTSRASLIAARQIMQHVSERFNEEHGTAIQYAGRFDRIPLCVDTDVYFPRDKTSARSHFHIDRKAFVILYFGKLSLVKADLLAFAPIVARLVAANREINVLWVVAGTDDPPFCEQLSNYARVLGISKHLRFELNVPDGRKPDLLSSADVFVSPSDTIQESFGLAPIEAMACGVPQVVSDWNGYRDTVLHGKTGFLVPTYCTADSADLYFTGAIAGWRYDHLALSESTVIDLAKYQEYLQLLVGNKELRESMAQRSRLQAVMQYSFPAVIGQYEALLHELSESAKKPFINKRKAASFNRPDYSRFFGHYATHQFRSDSVRLILTEHGQHALSAQKALPYSAKFFDLEIFEEQTAQSLLRCFADYPDRTRTLADLVQLQATSELADICRVRRHIMLLVKSGLLRIESGDNTDFPHNEPATMPVPPNR